jgi:uncharacterized membrane protein
VLLELKPPNSVRHSRRRAIIHAAVALGFAVGAVRESEAQENKSRNRRYGAETKGESDATARAASARDCRSHN